LVFVLFYAKDFANKDRWFSVIRYVNFEVFEWVDYSTLWLTAEFSVP
jgi:hypothetical protein